MPVDWLSFGMPQILGQTTQAWQKENSAQYTPYPPPPKKKTVLCYTSYTVLGHRSRPPNLKA